MADDLGYSDLGCYGSEIRTPNIDSLAAGGIRFTHFYNAARCVPTRGSVLTGLYPQQAQVVEVLNDQCVTLAEVLKTAGYNTCMSGKWHVGQAKGEWPVDRGFDKYYGLLNGRCNYFNVAKTKYPGEKALFAENHKEIVPEANDFYSTDVFTDKAIGYIDHYTEKNEPFFLYLAYNAPHFPLHALPEDIERYRGKYMAGWDEIRRERYERMREMGIIDRQWDLSQADAENRDWEKQENKESMDIKMAVFAAQIDRMDQCIGRVLKKIRSAGIEDDTLVLFMSDNGGCAQGGAGGFDTRLNSAECGSEDSYMGYGLGWASVSNTPFRRHKNWVHEGGISAPLIAYWPGVIDGDNSIKQEVCHAVDIMPTLAEAAGAKYPERYKDRDILPTEGKSLLGLLKGEEHKSHEVLFWEHEGNRAVRKGKWKLVSNNLKWIDKGNPGERRRARKHEPDKWELYDMQADRTEMNDLAEKYPDKVKELYKIYTKWSQRVGLG
jgi:arylsulfatase